MASHFAVATAAVPKALRCAAVEHAGRSGAGRLRCEQSARAVVGLGEVVCGGLEEQHYHDMGAQEDQSECSGKRW